MPDASPLDSRPTPLSRLVFPDPVTGPSEISGAQFLFWDEPFMLTAPPVVLAEGAFDVLHLTRERVPAWGTSLLGMYEAWAHQQDAYLAMRTLLRPVEDLYVASIWAYDATSEALDEAGELVASLGLSLTEVFPLISPLHACGDVMLHVLLETYLLSGEDPEAVYQYCNELFRRETIPDLLTKAYLLRISLLNDYLSKHVGTLLLNNHAIANLVLALSNVRDHDSTWVPDEVIVAWELFWAILARFLDPISESRIELIADIRASRRDELRRLRDRCFAMGEQVSGSSPQDLEKNVEAFVRKRVRPEIQDLLRLNQRSFESFVADLFSDRYTWLSAIGAISAVVGGHAPPGTAASLALMAAVGPPAARSVFDRRQELKRSDFAIIYRIAASEGLPGQAAD